jgi:hypothetical protein
MDVLECPPDPPPASPLPTREIAWTVGSGLLLVGLCFLGSWWLRPRITVLDRVTGGRLPDGPYAGSRECAECHPGEYAHFTHSGHARSFQPAAESKLARRIVGRTVADPELPGVTWTYVWDGRKLLAERRDPEKAKREDAVERFLLEYALGSGHHSMSFLTVTDPSKPTSLEHRFTYYPPSDVLDITPGQRAVDRSKGTTIYGKEMAERTTLRCFGCHTTPTRDGPPTPPGRDPVASLEPVTPYVSCERCHGPARAHVEEARRGKGDLTMPFGEGRWTAESQMGLCGQCHRHPSIFPADMVRPEETGLARFQPVGLMRSKCYTRSDGAFSCVTCHDPHARASSNRVAYEVACLNCHGSAPQVACRVSPRQGCIECHMPRVDSGQRVLFTDHWIRIRENDGATPKIPQAEACP